MRSDTLNNSSGKYGGRSNDVVFVIDAAAVTLNSADSGKVHVIPDLTADSTFSLPSAEAGLAYEFWYGGTAADTHDWLIDTGADANYFVGGLVLDDTDDGSSVVVDSNGSSNSKMAVLTPIAGTLVKLVCDGVKWYVNGQVVSATDAAVTFADQ